VDFISAESIALYFFFRWVALRFREITYAKKGTFPSGIFLSNAKQKKPFVLLDNEINEASH